MRAAVILCAILATSITYADVREKVDRFTGETTIKGSPPPNGTGALSPGVTVSVKPDGTYTAEVYLISSGTTWRFLQCHDTHWLVDSKPFSLPEVTHKGVPMMGIVVEMEVSPGVTLDQIAAIGASQSVEFEVCGEQGAFTASDISDFAEVARRAREKIAAAQKPAP